ncbi:hypothetical protein AJ80_07369 [Polytolypa hystricis UAMH7299]|uniref:Leucine-rich repeat domain-containing protein n=1 Tax=Polytolypa hystricis (strain UAMH7299) TaxID=1447883 RepID=A0A2B7XQD9_POLH7|nr:hypothetical protein AJ80_07369 [Polytolypa hystricis UAMH7299]
MAPHFQDLASEIHLLIAQHLGTHDSLNLLSCSHYFYALLLPLAYKRVEVRGNWFDNIISLVQTALRNPQLCTLPRTLHIAEWTAFIELDRSWHGVDWIRDLLEDLRATGYDAALVNAKVKQVSCSENEEKVWTHGLETFNPDAWVGLLLTLFPNLTRLEIQFPERGVYVRRVVERAAKGEFDTPVLASVSEVFVTGWDNRVGLYPYRLMPFFALPSIRRFSCYKIGLNCSFLTTRNSSITDISIDSVSGVRELRDLVLSCPNLESYRHTYMVNDLSCSDVYGMLRFAKRTLKTIWLDISEYWLDYHERDLQISSPLMEFTALKLLHLPGFSFVSFLGDPQASGRPVLSDIIPPWLEILHIVKVGGKLYPKFMTSLLHYINSGKEHNMRLAELVIETWFCTPNIETPEPSDASESKHATIPSKDLAVLENELKQACSRENIRLCIHEKGDPLLQFEPMDSAVGLFEYLD